MKRRLMMMMPASRHNKPVATASRRPTPHPPPLPLSLYTLPPPMRNEHSPSAPRLASLRYRLTSLIGWALGAKHIQAWRQRDDFGESLESFAKTENVLSYSLYFFLFFFFITGYGKAEIEGL